MPLPKFIILLLSGGLDSVVLLYYLIHQGCKVHCVLFDYGQRHVQELGFAKHHCRRLNVLFTTITIPQLKGSSLTDDEKKSVVVPFRNAVLLAHAVSEVAVAAGAESVAYACNKDDEANFPDCRMAFVQAYNILLLTSEVPVEVVAPFIDKPKWWIADLGRQLGVPMDMTWSCYRGGAEPCGECEACKKRNEAMVPRVGFEGVSRES